MKRNDDGHWLEFETVVGRVKFSDPNGQHAVEVRTDGEFWRVVVIDDEAEGLRPADLTPEAARKLATLLLKAADVAEREAKALAEQDKRIEAAEA